MESVRKSVRNLLRSNKQNPSPVKQRKRSVVGKGKPGKRSKNQSQRNRGSKNAPKLKHSPRLSKRYKPSNTESSEFSTSEVSPDVTDFPYYSYGGSSNFYGDILGFEELNTIIHEEDYPQQACYQDTPDLIYYNLTWCLSHSYITKEHMPPPCIYNQSQLLYDSFGNFLPDATFYGCLNSVTDSASMPTFYNNHYHGCLFVYTSITLLNLVEVDEVSGSVNLQALVTFEWTDYRYTMPLFWQELKTAYSYFDLTNILTNQSTVMWLPDYVFPDAVNIDILADSLLIAPYFYGEDDDNDIYTNFYYQVTMDLTLVQSDYDFRKYPQDTQTLVIRYSVRNIDAEQLQLYPYAIFCSYIAGADLVCSFSQNQIWNWNENDLYCTTYNDYNIPYVDVFPAYAQYEVSVTRSGEGIIVRLVLPLTLLLLLSALTFWIKYEERVNTTITLLLSVSALYIIILQNVPLVGYLTDIDKFVFWMFLLLCIVCTLHQIYATLIEKLDRWPLRQVYIRLIETIGRTCVPPAIIGYFVTNITLAGNTNELMLGATIAGCAIVFIREAFGLYAAMQNALARVIDKVNNPETMEEEVSKMELLVLNFYLFRKLSMKNTLVTEYLTKYGEIRSNVKNKMKFNHVFMLSSLLNTNNEVHHGKGTLFHQRNLSVSNITNGNSNNNISSEIELNTFQSVNTTPTATAGISNGNRVKTLSREEELIIQAMKKGSRSNSNGNDDYINNSNNNNNNTEFRMTLEADDLRSSKARPSDLPAATVNPMVAMMNNSNNNSNNNNNNNISSLRNRVNSNNNQNNNSNSSNMDDNNMTHRLSAPTSNSFRRSQDLQIDSDDENGD